MQSTSLIFTGTCSAWQQPVCKVRPCVRRIVTQQTNRTTRTRPYYSAHCEIKTELWFSNVSQNDRAPVFGTSSTRVVCRAEPDKEQDLREATEEFAELNNAIEKAAAAAVENLQGTSLFLVGMMGTGKSTVGKMLSQALGYCFFDTDALIEQLAGKTVAEIFNEDGEPDFRALETEVLQEIAPFARCVVATGGGAACKSQNWGHMQTGISIWLNGSPAMLAKRVVQDSSNDRPLVAIDDSSSKSDEQILEETTQKLENILEARREQYGYSDLTVSLEDDAVGSGAPPGIVVLRILTSLNDRITRDAKEREERKRFEIVNNELPESMRVVDNINQVADSDPFLP